MRTLGIILLSLHLGGCACWAFARGDGKTEVGVEVVNETSQTICGVYIWRPEHEGGTGIVATSPEMNNILARGTYMVADEHPKALHAGDRRAFGMRVSASDRFHIRARDCEENVIFERQDVCLASGLELVVADEG